MTEYQRAEREVAHERAYPSAEDQYRESLMTEDEIAAEFRRALERAIRRRRRAAFLSGLVDGMALGPLRRRFAHVTLLWLANRCLRPFGVAVGHLVEGDGRGPGVLWHGTHVRGSWGLARRQPDGTWRAPAHLGGGEA